MPNTRNKATRNNLIFMGMVMHQGDFSIGDLKEGTRPGAARPPSL